MKRSLALGVAAALPFLALGACGRLETVKRCRALAQRVNPALDAIERDTKQRTPQAYASASRAYAALARELASYTPDAGADAGADAGPRDAGAFERGIGDYRLTLESASRHAAGLAAALDAGNPESAAIEARELEAVAHQSKGAVRRIDLTCRPE